MTTKPPDAAQIEVAIAALEQASSSSSPRSGPADKGVEVMA